MSDISVSDQVATEMWYRAVAHRLIRYAAEGGEDLRAISDADGKIVLEPRDLAAVGDGGQCGDTRCACHRL